MNLYSDIAKQVDPSLLAASIQNSESIFGHRQAKSVGGEATQAALLGKDAIVTAPRASIIKISRSHRKISITVLHSNGGKTVNDILFAACHSYVEHVHYLNI